MVEPGWGAEGIVCPGQPNTISNFTVMEKISKFRNCEAWATHIKNCFRATEYVPKHQISRTYIFELDDHLNLMGHSQLLHLLFWQDLQRCMVPCLIL